MTVRDVLVVGGGPAGATAAATAARAGLDVMVLEAGEHPRPHVGESLLPGIIPILEDIDALHDVQSAGFWTKTGSTLWNWGRTPRWDLWFADSDAYDHAWLVDRSRFDALLWQAALRAGAEAHTRAVARELVREGDRIVGVRWRARGAEQETVTHARFVIDATGQSSLGARAFDLRAPIEGLRHQAMWAHFEGVARLPEPRGHQALFVAQPDQWWWCFPLADGRASIGVVQLDAADRLGPPRPDFDAELRGCAELADLLGNQAQRVTPVRNERDWSYRMRDVAGPGWMLAGDAAGFIDPVLSTGVMLALHSGWHAARTAKAIITDGEPEHVALARYRDHHREMFDDLLRMVRFYYQQNVHRDAYFWESKRILMRHDTALRPQKAFVILTSGLVQNLALDERSSATEASRRQRTETGGALGAEPATLGFFCVHLRHRADGSGLFLLVEPADEAAPTLFRTRSFHVNAIAPIHGNDPISNPALAPVIEAFHRCVVGLDTVPEEDLVSFWRRCRARIAEHLAGLPETFELVRVFGQ